MTSAALRAVGTPTVTLPAPLAMPLRLLPPAAHGRLLAALLNHVLRKPLEEGELDFMEGRVVGLRVDDLGLQLALTGVGGRIAHAARPPEVTISGNLHAFLLMTAQLEDPDTLFFQQRLALRGDTALGLTVKNLLDGLDWADLPLPEASREWLRRALRLYEGIFARRG